MSARTQRHRSRIRVQKIVQQHRSSLCKTPKVYCSWTFGLIQVDLYGPQWLVGLTLTRLLFGLVPTTFVAWLVPRK
jgi:hypothetical protein